MKSYASSPMGGLTSVESAAEATSVAVAFDETPASAAAAATAAAAA
jgi:hypothetical protein